MADISKNIDNEDTPMRTDPNNLGIEDIKTMDIIENHTNESKSKSPSDSQNNTDVRVDSKNLTYDYEKSYHRRMQGSGLEKMVSIFKNSSKDGFGPNKWVKTKFIKKLKDQIENR